MGIPGTIRACLFDLDGVLTDTAALHSRAWAETFDVFLHGRAEATGEVEVPFSESDYRSFVDGRLRSDGARTFLLSRGIELPEHSLSEADARDALGPRPELDSVDAIVRAKNSSFLSLLRTRGAETFPGSLRFVETAKSMGLRLGVVSASRNSIDVLEAVGLAQWFETVIDGTTAARRKLRGKPAPDMFLAGAVCLGTAPAQCAVFEDAVTGISAGVAGGFGWVVGVDRGGDPNVLAAAGASVVVADLADLLDEA